MSPSIPKERAYDNAVYMCFSCEKRSNVIFAKINRSALQYVVCDSNCLNVALERLGLIGADVAGFRSPVNITVRNSPTAFVNTQRSPISRSPGSTEIDRIGTTDEIDSDPDCLKQVEILARKRFKTDD